MDAPTQLVVRPVDPLSLIQSAIDKGLDPDKLGKLMDLQERYEKNRAAEAFAEALCGFQADCPPIFKGREAQGGKMKFAYASFDDVMREAGPVMKRHNIVATYTTEQNEKLMRIVCRIRVGAHVEETTVNLPIPAGLVNDTQLYGQAVSYGKRYALCAALGIVVTDEDNDGNQLECIAGDEIEEINTLLDECREAGNPVDFDRFLKWLGVARLEELPRKQFARAIHELNRKRKAVKSCA